MKSMQRLRQSILTLIVTLLAALPAFGGQWQFDGIERVVAVSDIHGAYEHLVPTLRSAGLVDEQLKWSGASSHLVVVGDMLDRGPRSRDVMDLLMRLEGEAAQAGGEVHVLIGNHEAMNLVGDLRYVSKEEYAAFADEEQADERAHWLAAFVAKRGGEGKSPEALQEEFDRLAPPGFFGHRRAFASDGKYGRWLLQKPILIVINGTAFVHGGISPMVGQLGLDGVNGRLHDELREYVTQLETLEKAEVLLPTDNFYYHPKLLEDYLPGLDTDASVLAAADAIKRLNESEIHATDGPLWYRGNASCDVLIEADKLDAALAAIGARRVVIGHTPTPGRHVLERLDGRVVEVDTGMLANYYDGSGNALVMTGDSIAAVNESGRGEVAISAHPRHVGQRPAGLLEPEQIEQLLTAGNIVASKENETGKLVVTVSDGVHSIDAVFAKRAGRGFYPDVAAYRLDRLLRLDMVPVTVLREVDGTDGSLQFKPIGAIDETVRHEKGYGGGAQCPITDQWDAMFVFDALVYNEGRFASTLLYSPDTWQLMLVDYGAAFVASKGRPRHLVSRELTLNRAWRDALTALTDDVLAEGLSDVLDNRRLRALGERRDELLKLP
jgi:Calcineurin-like phosphoesterase